MANSNHISHFFYCFFCWLWTGKWLLRICWPDKISFPLLFGTVGWQIFYMHYQKVAAGVSFNLTQNERQQMVKDTIRVLIRNLDTCISSRTLQKWKLKQTETLKGGKTMYLLKGDKTVYPLKCGKTMYPLSNLILCGMFGIFKQNYFQ